MHKLVILIKTLEDWQVLEDAWPDFLHRVEEMPGLRKEVSCRVEQFLYGTEYVAQIHELYFDTLEAARQAMTSPPGREAGRILQTATGGQMVLFFADHQEDDLDNIRKHKQRAG